jgi:coronin-1B/1C/6
MRAYKTVNDSYIEPISFTVPRRAETFQSDIYPPAIGTKPAVSAKDWLAGKTGIPSKIDLESIYDGNAPVEVAANYKPPAEAPADSKPPAVSKPPPRREPEPETRAPPPTVSDQKASIAAMANKFHDDEEEDEEDEAETSSFEEISRPAQRSAFPVREAAKPSSPIKPTPAAAKPTSPASPIKSPPPQQSQPPTAARAPPAASAAAEQQGAGTGGASVMGSLGQIKQLLEAQSRMMSEQGDKIQSQSEQIGLLTGEVETLKKRVVTVSQDQSERIRQLELELEAARS